MSKRVYDQIQPPDMSFDDEDGKGTPIKSIPQTKCIWDLCIQATERAELNTTREVDTKGVLQENSNKSVESTMFVVGAKSAAKTSIILRFLDRDEQPKPTTALEYTFGRRSKNNNMLKDVAHVWELGGGIALSNLIEVPITKQCVKNLSVVICVDLSKPETIWTTLESLLNTIKLRAKKVIAELKRDCPSDANQIVAECLARYGSDHPDKDNLDIIPIPITIIGTKYDEFQNFDPEKKKIISKTLRYVAHHHGAHLCYFSSKMEALVMKTRGLLGHLVFKTQLSKTILTDHSKPIYVLAGMDALSQIGAPPAIVGSRSTTLDNYNINDSYSQDSLHWSPLEQWKQLFLSTFPQEAEAVLPDDPTKDTKYNESIIDSVRSQKDEELERFKKLQERKMREEARREGRVM
ncbi:cytoplasmic dynein 2 light intermediate chain 1-like isoform X2 [Bolinopsis microptera]|uniref:cytoplasmic dynein 2 light intermediate chain 1-like isoform X2 n=1 Tax=Bolinopsis microptera TaxID=2820187 RepID=UPI00307976FC